MQIQFNGTPVFSGDVDSMIVIFNNLGGANFDDKARWNAYIEMMNSEFFRECPLTPGARVELLSKGVSYGAFIHSEARGDLGFGAKTPAFNRVLTLGGQRSA